MQFIDKQKIMPEYIDRTLENLTIVENIKLSTYEVTQLINSFIGLLILPNEERYVTIEDSDIQQTTLADIKNATKLCLDDKGQTEDKSLQNIVRHLRNSVCHFRIEFYGNNKIEAIKFYDLYNDKKAKKFTNNFFAEIDIKLLRAFVVEFGKSMRDKYRPKK